MKNEKRNETVSVLISAEQISARVKALAAGITRDYAGHQVTLVCTLKGAVIFLADLAREIKLDVQLEFVKVSSYDDKARSEGDIKLDYPSKLDIKGRHVIIVEDIVDMGYTARWLQGYMKEFSPASVRLCALLDKPERRKVQGVEIEYLGFKIPDKFVVGYGMDYAQRYRNLPYVGVLQIDEDEVSK
ncbi:MAG: hypoxanthine phosphoribosyltransferase [Defluviitaleaceae bacterium]|nr:hypoxanthine phosphoribosyltransferase [Defluviitaleaceae bacterium]